MSEQLLFVTGRLAKPRLEAVLSGMAPPFTYEILDIGVIPTNISALTF